MLRNFGGLLALIMAWMTLLTVMGFSLKWVLWIAGVTQ